MALGVFIAGRYSSVWNSVAMGLMEQGYSVEFEPKSQVINRSDAYGDTMIDAIYRGGDYALQCDALEFKAGTTGPAFPFAAQGTQGVIARLHTDMAQALVLTATAGTPAAAAPATLTATKALLAPNARVALQYTSELRKVPLRLQLWPYDAGSGVIKHFVTS